MTKENNGKGARKRAVKQLLSISVCVLVFTVGFVFLSGGGGYSSSSTGGFGREQPHQYQNAGSRRLYRRLGHRRIPGSNEVINENEMDPHELASRYRRELLDQFESQDEVKLLDDILNARLHLIEVNGVEEEVVRSPKNSYAGVYGSFCRLNFGVHKQNPSSVPMFRDIVGHSDCDFPFELDLKRVAYLARQRDKQVQESHEEEVPKVLNFTAAAFHESRCGSTLVANSMIAMDPEKHRTYSESSPPIDALRSICGDNFKVCSQEQAAMILKDTIYLMSRTDDPREERVFFKFQSITSKSIPTFQMAFPDVAWMYIYRDPVQVMMSHVKDDPELKRAICTRSMHGRPPTDINNIATRHGRQSALELKRPEYCAAHLASLTESAVENLNDMAIPVNYDKLPNILWEKIMPKIFGRPLTQTEISNLEAVSHDYSKGRGRKAGEFTGDSEQKERAASEQIRQAAKEFLQESFDTLNNFEPKLLM